MLAEPNVQPKQEGEWHHLKTDAQWPPRQPVNASPATSKCNRKIVTHAYDPKVSAVEFLSDACVSAAFQTAPYRIVDSGGIAVVSRISLRNCSAARLVRITETSYQPPGP